MFSTSWIIITAFYLKVLYYTSNKLCSEVFCLYCLACFEIEWFQTTPNKSRKTIFIQEKFILVIWLTFNLGLALTSFRMTRPQIQANLVEPAIQSEKTLCQWSKKKKHANSQWAQSSSLQYGAMILVSRYLVLTGVNWP